MFYYLYKITNLVNGKIYVGVHKTSDLNDGYMGSGKVILRALKRYGTNNFKKEILEQFDCAEAMFAREKEIVTEEFLARKDTYNLRRGGFGGFDHINKTNKNLYGKNGQPGFGAENLSSGKEMIIRLKAAGRYEKYAKDMAHTIKETYRNGRINAFKGMKHTPDTKRKIGEKNSKTQSGDRNSQFGSVWITNGSGNKKIRKTDPVPEGWKQGRIMKR